MSLGKYLWWEITEAAPYLIIIGIVLRVVYFFLAKTRPEMPNKFFAHLVFTEFFIIGFLFIAAIEDISDAFHE